MRKFYYNASADYITGATGGVQTEEYQGQFNAEFNNGDFFNSELTNAFEAIVEPFEVARGVFVPPGEYRFTQGKVSYQMGLQRRISGGITLGYGGFYDGTLTEATWRGRVEFTPQLYAEPTLSWNRIDAPFGNGNTNLLATRLTYTVTPRMFVAALVQYHVDQRLDVDEPALPVGVPAGQRAVRRLQRRPHHHRPGLSRPAEPLVRGEGDQALPLVEGG